MSVSAGISTRTLQVFPTSQNSLQRESTKELTGISEMATDLTIILPQIPDTVDDDGDYTPAPSDPGLNSDSDSDSNSSQLLIGESLIPVRERKHPGTTTVTIDGLLKTPLLLKEDLKEGCGGQLWPAGLLLSRYMLEEHATDLVGKTIVELGAGGGLVGLAVARGCQTDQPIYITDQEPMLQLMQFNITLNDLSSKVKSALLDWAYPPSADIPEHPAIVLAADCIYFEPAFPLLISTLQRLLGPQTVCYFCFKRRRRADLRCIKMIKKIFSVQEIRSFSSCDGYNRENLFLYKIQSRYQLKNSSD